MDKELLQKELGKQRERTNSMNRQRGKVPSDNLSADGDNISQYTETIIQRFERCKNSVSACMFSRISNLHKLYHFKGRIQNTMMNGKLYILKPFIGHWERYFKFDFYRIKQIKSQKSIAIVNKK